MTHAPAFWLSGGRGCLLMAAVFVLGSAWIFITQPVEGAVTGGAIPKPARRLRRSAGRP